MSGTQQTFPAATTDKPLPDYQLPLRIARSLAAYVVPIKRIARYLDK